MDPWQIRPQLAAAALSVTLTTIPAAAAEGACSEPAAAGYAVEFPQGEEVPVKLYQTNKGGGIGSVPPGLIDGKLLLCSDKIGSVNEVRLPAGTAIDLDAGKAATPDDRYWVRSNQVSFTAPEAQNAKQFICERNQVKTRLAGGAAAGESCK